MSRVVNYRNKIPEEVRRRQDEANNVTIYLLKEFGPTSFLIQDDEDRKFKVHIGDVHSCTCTTFKATGELCVHLCWILLKRFRLDANNPLSWQLGFVQREILGILDGSYVRTKREKTSKDSKGNVAIEGMDKHPEMQDGTMKQRPIEPEDLCPICQEELLNEHRYPVTYCRRGCGNSVHIRCMRVWAEHQRKQKTISLPEYIPCPMCREDFASLGLLLRELSEDNQSRAKNNLKQKSICPPSASSAIHKPAHPSTRCKSCNCTPIIGNLYRCQQCYCDTGDETGSLLCNQCFREKQHAEHNLFEFRETVQSKWFPVDRTLCFPFNLGNSLIPKFAFKLKEDGTHRWQQKTGPCDTLKMAELSKLAKWTVRLPTQSRSAQCATRTSEGSVSELNDPQNLSGANARVQQWGHEKTSGLLAPGRQCRICLMTYRIGDVVRRLNPGCQHVFHAACIDLWLLHVSGSCPLDGISVRFPGTTADSTPKIATPVSKFGSPNVEGIHVLASGLRVRSRQAEIDSRTVKHAETINQNISNNTVLGIVGLSVPPNENCSSAKLTEGKRRTRSRTNPSMEPSPVVKKWQPRI